MQTDLGPAGGEYGDVWDVFGVDRALVATVRAFVTQELRPQCRMQGMSPPAVLIHDVEQTREYYPEIFERWLFEKWQAATAEISSVAVTVISTSGLVWEVPDSQYQGRVPVAPVPRYAQAA